jgi:hypothetical protein
VPIDGQIYAPLRPNDLSHSGHWTRWWRWRGTARLPKRTEHQQKVRDVHAAIAVPIARYRLATTTLPKCTEHHQQIANAYRPITVNIHARNRGHQLSAAQRLEQQQQEQRLHRRQPQACTAGHLTCGSAAQASRCLPPFAVHLLVLDTAAAAFAGAARRTQLSACRQGRDAGARVRSVRRAAAFTFLRVPAAGLVGGL